MIPVDSISTLKIDISNKKELGHIAGIYISITLIVRNLPGFLDDIPCQAEIRISNSSTDPTVEETLPLLANLSIKSLSLDLNYTTQGLTDAIVRYLSTANESLTKVNLHIFDQFQLELFLKILSTRKKMTEAKLILHSEAMVNLPYQLYQFRMNHPFIDLVTSYITQREETFTVRSLLKKLKA